MVSAEISRSFEKMQIAVETRRNRVIIVMNRCVPVCGCRAGEFGSDLAQLQAQIRFEIEVHLTDL